MCHFILHVFSEKGIRGGSKPLTYHLCYGLDSRVVKPTRYKFLQIKSQPNVVREVLFITSRCDNNSIIEITLGTRREH